MRGIHLLRSIQKQSPGITPAMRGIHVLYGGKVHLSKDHPRYAGNTRLHIIGESQKRDHPRYAGNTYKS